MIFERALRRELTSTAGAVLTTLFTITITTMVIRILGQAAGGKVASQDVIELIGFEAIRQLPVILILTGFISVLLVITRSYQDSEMVVWFASGMSLTRWIKPVLTFVLPIVLVTAMLSFVAAPWAQRQSSEFRERFQKREDISRVSPGKFQESASSNRVFFVEGLSGDAAHVKNIFVNTILPDGRISVVAAKQGTIEPDARGDKYLVMEKGRRYEGTPRHLNFDMMEFERYSTLISRQSESEAADNSSSSLPTRALLAAPTSQNLSELLWRGSLPMMGLLLALLAIPLAFVNPRGGRSVNMLIALLLFVLYSNMVSVLQSAVAQSKLSFLIAWWPIHAVAFITMVLLFSWRVRMNSPYHPLSMLASLRRARRQRRKAGDA